ncbi:MAG: acyl-CoA dehydrogenase family protein [Syntrophales bacterium]|jgi:alkylation response protein AidB-like acyl-CoA dehydrogenase|nr:acyl-CoA dehydrogenase family protein [Syntrophales bacterium]MCK9528068.1 acyl-CoA dehydrogenase family protein [Syntrophales bacterium]MDX9922336.1 acyl-CoA dehydrogenase family protein [Syntrophales bacterium]
MISFELSAEQKKLQEKINRRAVALQPLSLKVDSAEPGPIDGDYLCIIAEEKLNSFIIPDECGGHALDRLTLSIVTEEIGYGCAGLASIYAATVHSVSALLIGGSEEQQKKFLSPLLDPADAVASCCITEEKGGSNTSSFSTMARQDGEYYIITGEKVPVLNAGSAAFYIVWANSDTGRGRAGINTFVIPGDADGIIVGPYHDKPGLRCAPTATVTFREVAVPKSNLIGLPGSGYLLLMQTLDWGRAFFGAICVGLARAALEKSIQFAKKRVVSSRPIIKNQGISFVLSELAAEIDAARLLVWRACRLMDLNKDYTRESSMAKLFASEVAARASGKGMQILGKTGYLRPHLMSKFHRDSQGLLILEGTSPIQKQIIAGQL